MHVALAGVGPPNIMPKHGFHDYDNLQPLSKFSHVVIFGFQSLSLF
jgi:hypothetical protein